MEGGGMSYFQKKSVTREYGYSDYEEVGGYVISRIKVLHNT